MGVLFNTEMYRAGEDIMRQANDSIQNISDATVKNELNEMIDSSFDAVENNITVNNSIFKYGWVFMVVLIALMLFLLSRSIVETQSGRGFI
jgi:hypothetical protein